DPLVTGVQTCALPIFHRGEDRRLTACRTFALTDNGVGESVAEFRLRLPRIGRLVEEMEDGGTVYNSDGAVVQKRDARQPIVPPRSEERRVGKEGRNRQ